MRITFELLDFQLPIAVYFVSILTRIFIYSRFILYFARIFAFSLAIESRFIKSHLQSNVRVRANARACAILFQLVSEFLFHNSFIFSSRNYVRLFLF